MARAVPYLVPTVDTIAKREEPAMTQTLTTPAVDYRARALEIFDHLEDADHAEAKIQDAAHDIRSGCTDLETELADLRKLLPAKASAKVLQSLEWLSESVSSMRQLADTLELVRVVE
jgi:hypothetical protein